jgi:flagellar protein FlbT
MNQKRFQSAPLPTYREVSLREGEQAVINGALVTAIADSTFYVSAGASVIAGRPPRPRDTGAKPAHELYYAALGAAGSDETLECERQRLLGLLAETVASYRTREAQEQCSAFAVGLVAGDIDAMLTAARSLAEGELRGSGRPVVLATRAA